MGIALCTLTKGFGEFEQLQAKQKMGGCQNYGPFLGPY